MCLGVPHALLQHLKVKPITAPELSDLTANLYKYCCLSVWSFVLFHPPTPRSPNFSPVVHCCIEAEKSPVWALLFPTFLMRLGDFIQNLGKTHPEVGKVWLYAVLLGSIIIIKQNRKFWIHFLVLFLAPSLKRSIY